MKWAEGDSAPHGYQNHISWNMYGQQTDRKRVRCNSLIQKNTKNRNSDIRFLPVCLWDSTLSSALGRCKIDSTWSRKDRLLHFRIQECEILFNRGVRHRDPGRQVCKLSNWLIPVPYTRQLVVPKTRQRTRIHDKTCETYLQQFWFRSCIHT